MISGMTPVDSHVDSHVLYPSWDGAVNVFFIVVALARVAHKAWRIVSELQSEHAADRSNGLRR
jgi:hypothetical protein